MEHNRDLEKICKLFVGGLSLQTTDDSLKQYFETWGEVVDHIVVKHQDTGKSKGFGFVTYRDPEMVDAAQAARPHTIDDKPVQTKRAVPKDQSGRPGSNATVKRIFIGGVKDEVEEQDLRDYFGEYGKITDVHVVVDKSTQRRKGFVFVEFEDYDSVDKIVLQKDHTLKGRTYKVEKALPKEDKQGGGMGGGFRGGRDSQYGSGGGYGSTQSYGGGGGGYNQDSYSSGYSQSYGNNYSGGPVRDRGYQRRPGPY